MDKYNKEISELESQLNCEFEEISENLIENEEENEIFNNDKGKLLLNKMEKLADLYFKNRNYEYAEQQYKKVIRYSINSNIDTKEKLAGVYYSLERDYDLETLYLNNSSSIIILKFLVILLEKINSNKFNKYLEELKNKCTVVVNLHEIKIEISNYLDN